MNLKNALLTLFSLVILISSVFVISKNSNSNFLSNLVENNLALASGILDSLGNSVVDLFSHKVQTTTPIVVKPIIYKEEPVVVQKTVSPVVNNYIGVAKQYVDNQIQNLKDQILQISNNQATPSVVVDHEFLSNQVDHIYDSVGNSVSNSISTAVDDLRQTGDLANLTVSSVATSSFANGINIDSGCFSIAGVCIGDAVSAISSQWNTVGNNIEYYLGSVSAPYFTSTSTTFASTFPYASTTALSADTLCMSTDCRTTWPTAGAGSVYPFAPTNNFNVNNQATTGIAWFQNGFNASSTSHIASTTFDIIGNVGIGTTSPYGTLSVVGSTNTSVDGAINVIAVHGGTASTYNGQGIMLSAGNSDFTLGSLGGGVNIIGGSGGGYAPGTGGAINITAGAGGGVGGTGGNTIINGGSGTIKGNVILASTAGKVGIGTSTPNQLFTIAGNNTNAFTVNATGTISAAGGIYGFTRYDGINPQTYLGFLVNGTAYAAVKNNVPGLAVQSGGTFGWSSNTSPYTPQDTGLSRLSVGVVGVGNGAAGNATGTLVAGSIGIGSSTPGSALSITGTSTAPTRPLLTIASSTGAQLFNVLANGNVGIATSSPYAKLSVNGNSHLGGNVVATGTVQLTGLSVASTGNYLCLDSNNQITSGTTCSLSSERFKDHIQDIDLGLNTVLALNPVTFKFKQGYGDNGATTQLGFVAEQAESIDSRLVPHDALGLPSGFNYANYTAVLTKAIQEQQSQINGIKSATSSSILTANTTDLSVSLQNQQISIDSLQSNIKDLNLKLTNLQGLFDQMSTTTSVQASTTLEVISYTFSSFSARIVDGVLYIKTLFVENLHIGSKDKQGGITLYDKNGNPGCLILDNASTGQTKTLPGNCEDALANTAAIILNNPATTTTQVVPVVQSTPILTSTLVITTPVTPVIPEATTTPIAETVSTSTPVSTPEVSPSPSPEPSPSVTPDPSPVTPPPAPEAPPATE